MNWRGNLRKASYILLAAIISTSSVYAQSDTEESLSANDIYFYDPNACRIATGIGTEGVKPGTSGKEENIEAVLRYLTDRGLSLVAASGFIGNMTQESGVNPRAIQPSKIATDPNYQPVNGQGFGLVQWTWDARQKPLVNLAVSTGRNTTDMSLQMDYIWQELTTGYQQTLSKLVNTPDLTPQMATIIIHGNTRHTRNHPAFAIAPKLGYEASGDSAEGVIKNRVPHSVAAYNKYKGIIADGDSSKIKVSSSSPLDASEGNPIDTSDCGSPASGPLTTINGMTFPVAATKKVIKGGPYRDGKDTWCWAKTTNCHHDYNAVDVMVPEGTPIVAIKAGEIVSVSNQANGARGGKRAAITMRADDDGGLWFMTHGTPGSATVTKGQKVASGAHLMTVGNSAAADNTGPHLHIDMLPPQFKSRVSCASERCKSYPFVDIQPAFKQLYDAMEEG